MDFFRNATRRTPTRSATSADCPGELDEVGPAISRKPIRGIDRESLAVASPRWLETRDSAGTGITGAVRRTRKHRWSSRPCARSGPSAGGCDDEAGSADSCRDGRLRRLHHSSAGDLARYLGQQVPLEAARRHRPGSRDRRDLPPRRPGHCRSRGHRRAPRALAGTLSVGTASRRDSGRTHRLECGSAGAQAGDVDHQLHGVRDRPRFHGRHPGEGPRGRSHPQGRLWHRLRILHPAAQGGVRQRRRCVYVGAAFVHGHLRSDVLHGVVGRGTAGRADGHLRRRPSRCPGLHPCQARRRPPAPVQPLAARHPRIHAGGTGRRRVEARIPADETGSRARRHRSRRSGVGGVAELAGARRIRHEQCRKGRLPGVSVRAGPTDLGRHHVVDVRLRRAGVHPD